MYYDQLFERVQRIIAHPHDTLTAHDRCRAALIIRLLFDDVDAADYICSTLTEEEFKMMKQIRKQVDNKMRESMQQVKIED